MGYSSHLVSLVRQDLMPFLRFCGGALSAFLFNVGLTYILVEFLEIHYLAAYVSVQGAVIVYGFVFQLKIVFRTSPLSHKTVAKYATSLLAITALNAYSVKILTESAGVHYLVSIVFATGFFLLVKYFVYKLFVFR